MQLLSVGPKGVLFFLSHGSECIGKVWERELKWQAAHILSHPVSNLGMAFLSRDLLLSLLWSAFRAAEDEGKLQASCWAPERCEVSSELALDRSFVAQGALCFVLLWGVNFNSPMQQFGPSVTYKGPCDLLGETEQKGFQDSLKFTKKVELALKQLCLLG